MKRAKFWAAVMAVLTVLLACSVIIYAEEAEAATEAAPVVVDESGVTVEGVEKEDVDELMEFLRRVAPDKYATAETYISSIVGALEDGNRVKVARWVENRKTIIMIIMVIALMLAGSVLMFVGEMVNGKRTKTINNNAVKAYEEMEKRIKETQRKVEAALDLLLKTCDVNIEKARDAMMEAVRAVSETAAGQTEEMKDLVAKFAADRAKTDKRLEVMAQLLGVMLELHQLELSQMAISQVAKDKAASIVREAKEMVAKDENTTAV